MPGEVHQWLPGGKESRVQVALEFIRCAGGCALVYRAAVLGYACVWERSQVFPGGTPAPWWVSSRICRETKRKPQIHRGGEGGDRKNLRLYLNYKSRGKAATTGISLRRPQTRAWRSSCPCGDSAQAPSEGSREGLGEWTWNSASSHHGSGTPAALYSLGANSSPVVLVFAMPTFFLSVWFSCLPVCLCSYKDIR